MAQACNIARNQVILFRQIFLSTRRRRRGLAIADVDVSENSYDYETDPGKSLVPAYNFGPYCARMGRGSTLAIIIRMLTQTRAGKSAQFAVNALPEQSASLRHKKSVDQSTPLFVENKEIEPCAWKLGQRVQCFDGYKVKRVYVEPYMIARGAAARGPLEIAKVMQRHSKHVEVLYFCLMAIAKLELCEDEDGVCTRESRACILQTLSTLSKQADVQEIVAAALAALVQLAQNYASRLVIAKEEWSSLVEKAMCNVKFEMQEVIDRHAEGNNDLTKIRTATFESATSA